MKVREAMDVISGALDSLYEFYTDTDEAETAFETIGLAEAILEKLVKKEYNKPEEYWAVCPDCGHRLHYYDFECDDYERKIITYEASGYCPHCQKDIGWKEHFELIDIEYDED